MYVVLRSLKFIYDYENWKMIEKYDTKLTKSEIDVLREDQFDAHDLIEKETRE